MRAGNDHDRHSARHRKPKTLPCEKSPKQDRGQTAAKRNEGQPLRRRVGKVLGFGFACLGLFDQLDDTRKEGFIAGLVDTNREGPLPIDRSTDHFTIDGLKNRFGFACQHGLIERRLSFDNNAVSRNFLTGFNKQVFSASKRGDRNIGHGPIISDEMRLIRHKTREFL